MGRGVRVLLTVGCVAGLVGGAGVAGCGAPGRATPPRTPAAGASRSAPAPGPAAGPSAPSAGQSPSCPTPPPVGAPIGQLTSSYVDATIGAGSVIPTIPELNSGPQHYGGTALPGCAGNAAVAGHRVSHGGPFRHVDSFRNGDPITVTTAWGRFTYLVDRVFLVAPQQVEVLQPTAVPTLTLTACDPPGTTVRRIVVTATLQGPALATSAPTGGAAGPDGPDAAALPGGAG